MIFKARALTSFKELAPLVAAQTKETCVHLYDRTANIHAFQKRLGYSRTIPRMILECRVSLSLEYIQRSSLIFVEISTGFSSNLFIVRLQLHTSTGPYFYEL